MKTILNSEYGAMHGLFWMHYGAIFSFASVFLLDRGYSNTEIGIMFASGSILALILQPLLANTADRAKHISVMKMFEYQVLIMLGLSLCIFMWGTRGVFLSVIYVMALAWATLVQPLLNTTCFVLCRSGFHVNFGLCRGIGSVSYAALTAVLGLLVEGFSTGVVPLVAGLCLALLLALTVQLRFHYRRACALKDIDYIKEEAETKADAASITLLQFVRKHKTFILFSLGIIGLFFGNAMFNNYLFQIIEPLGGTEGDMGMIFGVSAALELPPMLLFDSLEKRFSCRLLIKVAAVGFIVKLGSLLIAPGISFVYIAQIAQLFSFGLLLPAMVHFINEIMSPGEAVRGQSVFTIMTTAGAIAASLAGGLLLDSQGPTVTLLVTTIVTAAGAAVMLLLVDRVEAEDYKEKGAPRRR